MLFAIEIKKMSFGYTTEDTWDIEIPINDAWLTWERLSYIVRQAFEGQHVDIANHFGLQPHQVLLEAPMVWRSITAGHRYIEKVFSEEDIRYLKEEEVWATEEMERGNAPRVAAIVIRLKINLDFKKIRRLLEEHLRKASNKMLVRLANEWNIPVEDITIN